MAAANTNFAESTLVICELLHSGRVTYIQCVFLLVLLLFHRGSFRSVCHVGVAGGSLLWPSRDIRLIYQMVVVLGRGCVTHDAVAAGGSMNHC